MQFMLAQPIARKLPALIVSLCLAACLSIAVVGYFDFVRIIRQETAKNLEVIIENRAEMLSDYFSRLAEETGSLGSDPTTIAAVGAFQDSYGLMIDSAGLQQAYIDDNPNPASQRDLLDQAPASIPYHFQHGRFHPFFRQIVTNDGLHDLVILNPQGDLMYSVKKGSDYATNLVNGPYADSGLAAVFQQALTGQIGQAHFSDFAHYAADGGEPAAFAAAPIGEEGGEVLGVVAIRISDSDLAAITGNPRGLGATGEVFLVGEDGAARTASRFEGRFDLLDSLAGLPQVSALRSGQTPDASPFNVLGAPVFAETRRVDVLGQTWDVIGQIDQAEVNAPAVAVRNKMILVTLAVAILSILVGWWVARTFVIPLGRLAEAMRQVANKQYDISPAGARRRDEIGKLFQALLEFRDKLRNSDAAAKARLEEQVEQKRVVETLSIGLGRLARGDLTHRINNRFEGDYDQLRQDFNETVDHLRTTIASLQVRANDIRSRADGMTGAAEDLSRRTESQAATLEQTAAALDEMTTSVRSAAAGAKEVAQVVTNASQDAAASRPVVASAVASMNAIAESSEEISKIIGVIDDIAFQTNLLALNAGVEAARAGDAGRGFAVVASEVRALAQRSSDAAKQIKALIGQSTAQVSDGVDHVGKAGEVLIKIAGHIDHISDLIAAIASGAEEQSLGLGEINIGVTQLDKVTQQNAAMVEEATANSHALRGDSRELLDLVESFQLDETAHDLEQFAADGRDEDFAPVAVPIQSASSDARM
jgi:methyl-accepting chemotaxis protein